MKNDDQVRIVWEIAKGYISGYKKDYRSSSGNLAPHFEIELLNDIAGLRKLSGSELDKAIEEVRGKLNVSQAVGMFSASDLERISVELDKIS